MMSSTSRHVVALGSDQRRVKDNSKSEVPTRQCTNVPLTAAGAIERWNPGKEETEITEGMQRNNKKREE